MVKDSDILERDDQRIVAALQVHPRAGAGEMGRILGEHERTVARRVQRLTAAGLIRSTAVPDHVRCGLGSSVQVRLRAPRGCLEEIAGALARRDEVLGVSAVSGGGGLLWCEVVMRSRPLLHSWTAEGVPGLDNAEVLNTYVTLRPFTTGPQWHAPVLTEDEEKRLRASMVQPLPGLADRYTLSPTDELVVAALTHNARISLTDLAKELGFSTATSGRRVASLLERRLLHLYTVVEPALLGLPVEARIRLKVHPTALEEVGTALAGSPAVRYCAAVAGRYNLLADVCVEHESALYRFTVEQLGGFAHILDYSTEIITHTYKRGPA